MKNVYNRGTEPVIVRRPATYVSCPFWSFVPFGAAVFTILVILGPFIFLLADNRYAFVQCRYLGSLGVIIDVQNCHLLRKEYVTQY